MNDLDLLRSAAPAVPAPDERVVAAGRAALLESIRAVEPYDVLPRRRRRRLALIAPALTAAAALTGVLLLGPAGDPEPASAAAQFLLASAEEVESSPDDAALADARWWYVRSSFDGHGDGPGTREIWLGRTEPGRVLVQRPPGSRHGDFDEALQEPASFHGLSWDELSALPTDPRRLRERIYELAATGGPSRDVQAFVVVGDLLRESPAPAAVRAALLRVAATLPDVELEEETVDSEGRTVVPVSLSEHDGSIVTRLMIQPDTGELLGEEVVAGRDLGSEQVGSAVPAGTVLHRMTVLQSGPVAAAGDRR